MSSLRVSFVKKTFRRDRRWFEKKNGKIDDIGTYWKRFDKIDEENADH